MLRFDWLFEVKEFMDWRVLEEVVDLELVKFTKAYNFTLGVNKLAFFLSPVRVI